MGKILDAAMCQTVFENIQRDFSLTDMEIRGDYIHYQGCVFGMGNAATIFGYYKRITTLKFSSSGVKTDIESCRARYKLSKFLLKKVEEKQRIEVLQSMERQFTDTTEIYQTLNNNNENT